MLLGVRIQSIHDYLKAQSSKFQLFTLGDDKTPRLFLYYEIGSAPLSISYASKAYFQGEAAS